MRGPPMPWRAGPTRCHWSIVRCLAIIPHCVEVCPGSGWSRSFTWRDRNLSMKPSGWDRSPMPCFWTRAASRSRSRNWAAPGAPTNGRSAGTLLLSGIVRLFLQAVSVRTMPDKRSARSGLAASTFATLVVAPPAIKDNARALRRKPGRRVRSSARLSSESCHSFQRCAWSDRPRCRYLLPRHEPLMPCCERWRDPNV